MSGKPTSEIKAVRTRMMAVMALSMVLMLLVSLMLLVRYASGAFELAYLLGALIGTANGAFGFVILEKFVDKSSLIFMKGVFLGMGIRLLLLLGLFIVLVKFFEVHIIGLVTGLLIFYFVMTIFEVVFLNKRIAVKSMTKN